MTSAAAAAAAAAEAEVKEEGSAPGTTATGDFRQFASEAIGSFQLGNRCPLMVLSLAHKSSIDILAKWHRISGKDCTLRME